MTQYMRDKKGKDTQVEFQGDKTSKIPTKLPKSRPVVAKPKKGVGKVYSNQPIRKPAWADDKVAKAVKRTKKQGLELKKGLVTKRRGSGEGTLRVIDPTKDELTPAEKTMKKRPYRKKGGTTKEDLNPTTKKEPLRTYTTPSGHKFGSGEYKVSRKTPKYLDKKKKLKT